MLFVTWFLSFQCHIEHVYIDKEENSAWFEKYRYDIPVIHLDGKFLMKHKVFTDALEEAIENSLSRIKRKRCFALL